MNRSVPARVRDRPPGCCPPPGGSPVAADACRPLVVDLDATLITAHSDKEGATPTFKRGYGHHPLWAFVDHAPSGTGAPLAVLLRKGNAGSVRHEVAHGELVASIGGRLMSTM